MQIKNANIAEFTARALIKILGNLSKVISYIFHFFLPRCRFLIPAKDSPLRMSFVKTEIPRTIWQTNFTNRVTLPVYLNYLFNRIFAPQFSYRFMNTEQRYQFVRENFPGRITQAYSKIQIGAAQADFWRILVLQKYGGVYMDIDAHQVWPLCCVLKPDMNELFLLIKNGELSNYFIASRAENPHLGLIINKICENIEHETYKNVYDLTGPGVLNSVLDRTEIRTRYYKITCNQGNFTNEYFQYIDKPQGKWTKEQQKIDVIRRD